MPWPAFVIQLAISVVSAAVSYAMAPKPDDTTAPNKPGRPVAKDGMIIPMVFGPALVRDVNVLGFGDVSQHAIIANGGK